MLKSMQSGGTINSTQVRYVQYLPRPDSKGQNVRESGINSMFFSVFSPSQKASNVDQIEKKMNVNYQIGELMLAGDADSHEMFS